MNSTVSFRLRIIEIVPNIRAEMCIRDRIKSVANLFDGKLNKLLRYLLGDEYAHLFHTCLLYTSIVQKKNYTLRTWQTEDVASLAQYLNNKNIWDNCRDGLPYPCLLYTSRCV